MNHSELSWRSTIVALLTVSIAACSHGPNSAASPESNDGGLLAVGAPCLLPDEESPTFSGSDAKSVDVDLASAACATHICLADHFQGRATCPYGQTDADITSEPADSPRRCRIQTPSGPIPVSVVVAPQVVSRRAADVVTCSCRCAGSDPAQSYCACPAGTECAPLIADTGLDGGVPPGSYCIEAGTELAPGGLVGLSECSATSTDPSTDCGNGRANP
jgi:hypothetical protein